ncbi:hypothetical protein AGLY_008037 [Aphis glycines]|uniref:Uncharacterized protein n=1 Tax=Aphis glycines TaxID=307491 RepID=A0A6G0TKP2_APHGL|nr:hypothetical protein AGLY_008037 [Aphis glycines]
MVTYFEMVTYEKYHIKPKLPIFKHKPVIIRNNMHGLKRLVTSSSLSEGNQRILTQAKPFVCVPIKIKINTHNDASLLLLLPYNDLYLRFSIFSAEYGLFVRGTAFSHLECSRSAIVPSDQNLSDGPLNLDLGMCTNYNKLMSIGLPESTWESATCLLQASTIGSQLSGLSSSLLGPSNSKIPPSVEFVSTSECFVCSGSDSKSAIMETQDTVQAIRPVLNLSSRTVQTFHQHHDRLLAAW